MSLRTVLTARAGEAVDGWRSTGGDRPAAGRADARARAQAFGRWDDAHPSAGPGGK